MSPHYDVFLSHSSADKPVVEELARRLLAAGLTPFLDKWNVAAGDPWQEALEQALDESRTCAVFLGPGGLGSWQNEEMRSAYPDGILWTTMGEDTDAHRVDRGLICPRPSASSKGTQVGSARWL